MNNIVNIDGLKIDSTINDIFRDLSILGYSNSFCKLLYLYYGKVYAKLLTNYIMRYSITMDEIETKFMLKAMRKSFACKNIDLDLILYEYGFEIKEDGYNYNFFNKPISINKNSFTVFVNELNLAFTNEYNKIFIL